MTSIILLYFIIVFSVINAEKIEKKRRAMPWICLEFCQETKGQISLDVAEIERHKDILTAVSFEKYTLGPKMSLVDNELTEVNALIQKLGLEAWPLLSSYPHPPQFINWMREVFRHPQPFIDQCVLAAAKYNYTGYNLDWEPTDNCSDQDGLDYATFINTFAKGLHEHGLRLSVDVAQWSPIWNYTAIAETSVDIVTSMGTYTATDESWDREFDALVENFGERAAVGLETDVGVTEQQLEDRFKKMQEEGIKEVDLWRLPVPAFWWPHITKFVSGDEF
jgi:hypothetical protein